MKLVTDVYDLTANLPSEEKYGLCSQMQRAAVAIPCNIAEGHLRRHRKEFLQFTSIALGSAGELETQVLICQSLEKISQEKATPILQKIDEIKKMLYAFSWKLEQTSPKATSR